VLPPKRGDGLGDLAFVEGRAAWRRWRAGVRGRLERNSSPTSGAAGHEGLGKAGWPQLGRRRRPLLLHHGGHG
jgi:hypothetical protein